ncbi:MAG: hypothetical protein EOQ62_04315 [Mesorhizobium sp.]|uniref:hypothetical protein n=1 Tax=Mesorhizobium sp. TaxID=1871066 RepID=UPI000FE4A176|nr:hypothetical protein [Mesorhizobium sp.]RWG50502.1 MAG: hypothetical protein EOQ62_04315 [Mesorhizobium sp.]RWL05260.1 MAG: hypothetical protein EOR55_13480 [Mesorhizobium sp.]TIN10282.1 MAG: hypothetical protein E5Y14_12225 [Mesorhizobium sp.]TIQ62110.1 MAG: hypothetical protein E5X41_29735 [Mesorhizobium sp.]
MRKIAIWFGIGLAILVAYAAKSVFEISDQTFTLSVLAALLVYASWHFSERVDALEERVIHKDYSGIKSAIEGERHVPKHQQPKSISDSGVKSRITAAHEMLFEDFRWFGTMLNRHVSDPWSIEELPDTEIRDISSEGPEYGRRYRVYYNSCEMGSVQVTVGGFDWIMQPEKFAANRQARVLIDLDYLRFVPYGDAHSLVSAIILHVGKFEDYETANARASAKATAALTEHLWEAVRVPEAVLDFEHRTDGTYELVRHTTDHWKEGGIDPFEKWGGDR